LAGGGTGAVVPGGQAGTTAASAVPRPSSGAAETAAVTSPVDAIRFRRVRRWRRAGSPGSDVDEVIAVTFLGDNGLTRAERSDSTNLTYLHAQASKLRLGLPPGVVLLRLWLLTFR
jgi:hypothetical protein